MKIKFRIFEVISQEFEMEFKDKETAAKEIPQMYHDGKLVFDNAELVQADVLFLDDAAETESKNMYLS